MTVRLRREATVIALTAALAACGGAAAPQRTTPPAHTATTAASVSSARPPAPRKRSHKHRKRNAGVRATSTTTSATVRTGPPPTPAGTPSPPNGLAATTGYGTYELCASQCSGAVPAALRRPLHLPHMSAGPMCPVSAGTGPVRPLGSLRLPVAAFIGSAWRAGRVTWTSSGSYSGPVLIRGRRLGGSGAVGFGEGRTPYDELQLLASGSDAPPAPGGARAWLSFTRVRSPGCFAYQVDGTSFSSVIVFEASG